jgi:hypothetical protein
MANQQIVRGRKKVVQPSHVLWLLLQRLQDVDFCFKGIALKIRSMKIITRSVKIEFEDQFINSFINYEA